MVCLLNVENYVMDRTNLIQVPLQAGALILTKGDEELSDSYECKEGGWKVVRAGRQAAHAERPLNGLVEREPLTASGQR